ncbi:MAG TPA: hypothetical protein PK812_04535 [Beijerinckiaceae bacterium]|nr:hypothetical protein [Beijerinckiaceae bacterium]
MRHTRQAGASRSAPEFRAALIAIEAPPEAPKRVRKGFTTSGKRKPRDLAPIRLRQVNRVLDLRYGGRADRDCVQAVIEVTAHLCHAMDGWPDNFRGWVRERAPTFNPANVAALIDIVSAEPAPWDGAAAGRILRLSEIDRQRLRAWTIEPFDLSPAERAESRKLRKREADKARRRKAGAKDRAQSAAKAKPWREQGVSRATWYREKAARDAAARETVSRTTYVDKKHRNARRVSVSPDALAKITVTTPAPPADALPARPALEIAA